MYVVPSVGIAPSCPTKSRGFASLKPKQCPSQISMAKTVEAKKAKREAKKFDGEMESRREGYSNRKRYLPLFGSSEDIYQPLSTCLRPHGVAVAIHVGAFSESRSFSRCCLPHRLLCAAHTARLSTLTQQLERTHPANRADFAKEYGSEAWSRKMFSRDLRKMEAWKEKTVEIGEEDGNFS